MNKNFQETASLSIVLSLFIHKISSKHDRDYRIQAEIKLDASHIHYTNNFLRRCQVQVLDTFRSAANEFYSKIFLLFILDFLKAYLQYKFTVQRVNEASFFEVTTSRSREDVYGFHNVTFGLGVKSIISCSVFR